MVNSNIAPGQGGVTYPSPNEWPVTAIPVTNITQSLNATVTAPNHGITLSANQSTPKVDFSQVKGMYQINGKFAFVVKVVDSDTFTVDLDTSQFYAYVAPVDRSWERFNNTPWQNADFSWNYFITNGGGFVNITGGNAPDDPLTNLFP